ncbi:hypothetical protein ACWKSP_02230 [Micromonosporaceae bacterium Da 78-11]
MTVPPPLHPTWRTVRASCVLVPLVVLAPLTALPLWSDQRLNIYGYGSAYLTRPWRLPLDVLEATPYFLGVGNFRPLGRIYEWLLDVLVFALVDLLGVPAQIGLRLVALAGAILLTLAAVRLAENVTTRDRPFARPPSLPVALVPFAVGAGLVAAGRMSTTVLFSGLYFGTVALVLATAAAACRIDRLGPVRGSVAVLAGAAIAAFNELACLAVPLATVAVAVRYRMVLARPWAAATRDPGVRFAALLWVGFLPVILPVRAVIAAYCADGSCYDGSEATLPGAMTIPNRLISWLPPLMWQWAAYGRPDWLSGAVPVVAFVVLLVPAWRLLRATPRLTVLDRRQALALTAVAATVLILAAAVGSLNSWVQAHAEAGRYGIGWRDSALATVGGAMLVPALLAALPGRGRQWGGILLLPVLVASAAVTTAANQAYHDGGATEQSPYLHDRIAQEMADFDPTAGGDARRCAIRAEYLTLTSPANEPRIDQILDAAGAQVAGRRFCSLAPVRAPGPLYRPAPD